LDWYGLLDLHFRRSQGFHHGVTAEACVEGLVSGQC
jgi:hypothetical protein